MLVGARSLGSFSILFVSSAFVFNFVWEAWQCVYLYDKTAGTYLPAVVTLPDFVHLITYASFVDAAVITSIAVLGMLIWRDVRWHESAGAAKILFFIGAALAAALAIELNALAAGKWAYSELMPTVFGIGLSPLVQLAVTGVLALSATRYIMRGHGATRSTN